MSVNYDSVNHDSYASYEQTIGVADRLRYSYAIVLKTDATDEQQLNILYRLNRAQLRLCILEPDELHPGTLCILAQAPYDLLLNERKKLSVENFLETGLYHGTLLRADPHGTVCNR
jgi:hypothetical protein